MENRENLHEWEKMLGESETLHLAVVEQSGYPMVYPMEKVSSVGLEQVLFITKKQSEKVRSLQKCKQCSIECHIEEKILWLLGTIEIVTEIKEIQRLLPENYWKRLRSHANFEDYCVLNFQTKEAKCYRNGGKKALIPGLSEHRSRQE